MDGLQDNLKKIQLATETLTDNKNIYITADYNQFLKMMQDNVKVSKDIKQIYEALDKKYEKLKNEFKVQSDVNNSSKFMRAESDKILTSTKFF